MPLSRLENFLINTDGNILYVNPSDLDATDSFDNKGNSLTRPFKTIQRAFLEAARFSYQSGANNDRFDRTTIMLYPGTHYIDNRPGLSVKDNGGTIQYYDQSGTGISPAVANLELTNSSIFNLENAANVLYKFNSVDGGAIIPKGTSLVGMDLRKTKIKPLYVPDPEDPAVNRTSIFRVTGGCYFWQFSIFDGDKPVFYNLDYSKKANPTYSHHKITTFEYADGINTKTLTGTTDLQQYYFKVMNAYGDDTGNREITNYPDKKDFEPNSAEFKIVGDLADNPLTLSELTAAGDIASVTTEVAHKLTVDDRIVVSGINTSLYNGTYNVTGITSERKFNYQLASTPNDLVVTLTSSAKVELSPDTVQGSSPYIFNCSLRSEYGMCGLNADGDKATGFKSMVVAQFTGLSLQKDNNAFVVYDKATGNWLTNNQAPLGEKPLYSNEDATFKTNYDNYHIRSSNDAFIQAVSVFAIGFSNHFLTESGADQSITNSNSNFGSKALVSKGYRKSSFDRDNTGYITHIVPPKDLQEKEFNSLWRALDVTKTVSVGTTSKLFLKGATDLDNTPTNITNGYRVGSKSNESLYINVNVDGVESTHTTPVLMQAGANGIVNLALTGPTSEKRFAVSHVNASNDTLNFATNHNFITAESVRVYSDTGYTPDGITNESQIYYVISASASSIKLAKTINNANDGKAIDIKNTLGGLLEVVSRVTDKVPGDPGHPVQWDTAATQWYVTGAGTSAINNMYQAFKDNTAKIEKNNATTYIKRYAENRDPKNRIYKLRYVIPKEYEGAKIAKAPEKYYILQESSTTTEESSIANVISNRNPRTIVGVSTSGTLVTVKTKQPHNLQINDRVLLKNVKSSLNATGLDNIGFNGHYYVVGTPSTKSFTYNVVGDGGTFTNDYASPPRFSRNQYDSTYVINEVETVQEYIPNEGTVIGQDGIYYLTCVISNISPTTTNFTSHRYKQPLFNAYPTLDKDNFALDPLQSKSYASNEILGRVSVDDSLNSTSKESTIEFVKDIGVGLGITGAISHTTGISTVYTTLNHNLNSVKSLTITNPGTGYQPGINTSVSLISPYIVGRDGTANITVSAGGTITAVEIVDGGSAYGVGNTVNVSTGNANAILTVGSIVNNVGDAVQVVGVGTTSNSRNSGYNGLYKITSIPSANTITYTNAAGAAAGVHTTSNGIAIVSDQVKGISSIAGITTTLAGIVTVTTSTAHGLAVGNKVKVAGVTGTGSTIFNSDFVVKEKVSLTAFTVQASIGIATAASALTSAEVYRYALGAYGEDASLATEKIAGSLSNMTAGISTTMSAGITTTSTTPQLTSTSGFLKGDFIQIDNEILRIKVVNTGTQITAIRGVLGTKQSPHDNGSIVKKVNVIPSEVRRFSSSRSSGHTFEYVGYGPGNYSTSLPQLREKTITLEEEILAQAREFDGGIIRYTGMNDRGDFFKSDERLVARENVLGEDLSDLTAVFDDVYIRNTLTVGGGPSRNLPSEFRGPVNFTNKITSTSELGIEGIKLLLRGSGSVNPSLQVGDDAQPTFILDQSSQNVGIRTATPGYEFDVNGTIRADVYENFKLSDLPDATEETTFKRNRFLKVKDDESGYELVDSHEIDSYRLRSYGVSNDGTVHVGVGSTVSSKIQISGISTSKFYVGEKVKVLGITTSSVSATIPKITVANYTIAKVGSAATVKTYYYWAAEYNYRDGRVGFSSAIGPSAGIGHTSLDNFNDLNHVSLTLARSSTNNGLLVYRQQHTGQGVAGDRDIEDSKLIGILGPKELGSGTSGIIWKDYGNYDQTAWSNNGGANEYDTDQIHFPNKAVMNHRRGWMIDTVTSVGTSSIVLSGGGLLNIGFGTGTATTAEVKVVHDNTYSLSQAIDITVADGGNYLDLPSGTYLTNKLIIPSGFTLKGNGKNTIIKQQYFAQDANDGEGTTLQFSGNMIGVGTATNIDGDPVSKDVTIQDLTIDGNFTNNILYGDPATDNSSDNYLLYLRNINSSLIKGVEVRNTPAHGLYVKDSTRLSIENCAIVDGGQTDRYTFYPVYAQDSTVLRLNDSVIENYSGPIDLSACSVVVTGGNIIRNAGTGLRMFASGKITTTNNIILGPSDEWIPSPDIHDSDYNSVNVTVDRTANWDGPVMQYIRDGNAYDVSANKVRIISAGIGTIVGQGTTNETLGTKFMNFDIPTPDTGTFGRQSGYIQLGLTTSQTATLGLSSALGYDIVAQEFLDYPVGYTTTVGIQTGIWNSIGAGQTQYTVTLEDVNQFPAFAVGDVVKLVNHSVSPSLASVEFTVAEKITIDAATKRLRLNNPVVWNVATNDYVSGWTVAGVANTTSIQNGTATAGDYISIRDRFTIAKGRVGVI